MIMIIYEFMWLTSIWTLNDCFFDDKWSDWSLCWSYTLVGSIEEGCLAQIWNEFFLKNFGVENSKKSFIDWNSLEVITN